MDWENEDPPSLKKQAALTEGLGSTKKTDRVMYFSFLLSPSFPLSLSSPSSFSPSELGYQLSLFSDTRNSWFSCLCSETNPGTWLFLKLCVWTELHHQVSKLVCGKSWNTPAFKAIWANNHNVKNLDSAVVINYLQKKKINKYLWQNSNWISIIHQYRCYFT